MLCVVAGNRKTPARYLKL